ncbi:MAG: hypothetical protein MJ177_02070 [Clostridia bacterium]|nr:hypothetical protein [Clostridia bacterium]
MNFYDISSDLIGCIRLLSFFVFVCTIYCVIKLIIQKQKPLIITGSVALFFADYFFFHLQLDYAETINGKSVRCQFPLAKMSLALILGIQAVLLILSLVLLHYCRKWEKTHLTVMSVKESLDNLPVGICYCNTDGKVLLINNKMHEFIKEAELTSGHNPVVCFGKLKEDAETDPVFEMADGSIYILRKNEINSEDDCFIEYLALDITKKYQLIRELETENKKLKERGDELRQQGKTIDEVILNREILDTKIKVHNNFGELLLASRFALTHDPDEKTKNRLIAKWRQTTLLREGDGTKEKTSGVEEINRAAKAIGVEIIYSSPLPGNLSDEHINIFEHMLHEALTNSFSHAHADKLFVSFTEAEEAFKIEISNNGMKPEGKIVEGGGLSSLRRLIESREGEMEITAIPEFILKASLKK